MSPTKDFVSAVILAAGSGTRMNTDITKQKIIIGSESILHRSVRAFSEAQSVSSVIVVVRQDEVEFASKELSDLPKIKNIVCGGKTRFDSARIGFTYAESISEYVAVHDAARCLITPDLIDKVAYDAYIYGAATASTLVTDTVKKVNREGFITKTEDRNELRLAQTPQIFKKDLYRKALENIEAYTVNITDDNMILENSGIKVYCTETGKINIKITTKEDLLYANYLLKGEKTNV